MMTSKQAMLVIEWRALFYTSIVIKISYMACMKLQCLTCVHFCFSRDVCSIKLPSFVHEIQISLLMKWMVDVQTIGPTIKSSAKCGRHKPVMPHQWYLLMTAWMAPGLGCLVYFIATVWPCSRLQHLLAMNLMGLNLLASNQGVLSYIVYCSIYIYCILNVIQLDKTRSVL